MRTIPLTPPVNNMLTALPPRDYGANLGFGDRPERR